MSPELTCLGIWSTVEAEKMFCEPSARSQTGPYASEDRLCAFGLPM